MPAFSPPLDDSAVWSLIQYLRALTESLTAQHLRTGAEPFLPVTAPDFAFEEWPRGQETLVQLRGHEVLLVVGALPESCHACVNWKRSAPTSHGRASVDPDGGEPRRFPGGCPGGPRHAATRGRGFRHDENVCDVLLRGRDSVRVASAHAPRIARRSRRLSARPLAGRPGKRRRPHGEIIAEARRLQREQPRPPAPLEHGH